METFDPIAWYHEECQKLGIEPDPHQVKKLAQEKAMLETDHKREDLMAALAMLKTHLRMFEYWFVKGSQ